MAAKRSAGEGSVFQTTNGRWAAVIELDRSPDGRRNRIWRRARTKAEAQRKLRELRAEFEDHGSVVPASRTVADAVADYVEKVRQPDGQRTGTRNKDRILANATVTHLGARRTSELTVQDVETFLERFASGAANASGRPVSRDYVRRLRGFVSRVLRNDMRLGLLNRDVAELATLPRVEIGSRGRRALTVDEWRRLYEASAGTTRLFVDLCGRHGLRPQEARALTWSAVDLTVGTLSIITQLDSDDRSVDPKTKGSTRTIQAHPELIEDLAAWNHNQAERRSARWIDRDLIIATRNGTPVSQENQRRSLVALCQRAGVDPVTPYELRHTALTHQVEAGHGVSNIADWAGTSEKMIYLHYRHRIRQVAAMPPVDYRGK